ncbi:MAG: hypothetical protein IJK22_03305 [Bacteroidales bacterium]|nr:hypothetical protein [Bacteroidales bacterium]
MSIRSIFLVFFLFLSVVCPLAAQHRDTVYVERETVTYDTVTVYDTVRVHDTLNIADYLRSEEFERLFYSSEYVDNLSLTDSLKEKLLQQTVTFWESRVFKDEQQTFSSMDSIKKYGLAGLIILGLNAMSPAQTDSTAAGKPHDSPKKHKTHLFDNPINGFHLGYTIQYDLIEPAMKRDFGANWQAWGIPHSGFHVGMECSYHFDDFFGISAALNFGTTAGRFFRFSAPVKFEFHYPVSEKVLFTANAGIRLRVPARTFLEGFDRNDGYWGHGTDPETGTRIEGIYERNIPYADIMLDAGIYYRLHNNDYLRFTAGLNFATANESVGWISTPGHDEPTEIRQRNNHLYFQIAYVQSFDKQRKIMQAQPHWSTEAGMHHRHEIRFEVGDPLGIMILQNKKNHLPNISGANLTAVGHAWRATPVFSFNYHYRLTKWLWAGVMINYAFFKDHTDYTYTRFRDCTQHGITLMPELRFSYLNRPHVTLYSAAALGYTIFLGRENASFDEFYSHRLYISEFPSFQLTAFGIRAGGEHLFGSFELGVGMKGFVSGGIGYAF